MIRNIDLTPRRLWLWENLMRKLLVILACIIAAPLVAAAEQSLSVHRDLLGSLTKESVRNLRTLIQVARKDGPVRVWVDFGIEFQPIPELRTPKVIANEQAQKRRYIAAHIQPIIEAGHATVVLFRPRPQAPGIMLMVDARALAMLGRNEHIRYIGQLTVTPGSD